MAKYIADIPDTYVVKDGYVNIPFSLGDSSDYMVETNIKVKPYDDKVKIGDELALIQNPKIKVCVTRLYDDDDFAGIAVTNVRLCCKLGETYSKSCIKFWEKTGKHYYEISKLFGDLEKEQNGES